VEGNNWGWAETNPLRSHSTIGRESVRGAPVGAAVAMRRPALVPLDRTKLPLTLAGGLRRTFAGVVSSPLPPRLAELVRRLNSDGYECSGGKAGHGASAAETSSHIDR
jgi:hypothetical protein